MSQPTDTFGSSPPEHSPGDPHLPDWQLPPGVDRPLWEYLTDRDIADLFDAYFAQTELLRTDAAFLSKHFAEPGRLLDLGCGTGRVLVHFARRGFHAVGLDLSNPMLAVIARKRRALNLPIDLVRGNLCRLDVIRDGSFDYAACMFSTLGMVIGLAERRRALGEIFRVLRPGGLFGLHLHNWWYNLCDPEGRRWLITDFCRRLRRSPDAGDKVMPTYRGIPNLRLHIYTYSEIRRELSRAGFTLVEVVPLTPERTGTLRFPWFFANLRANGWLILARRPEPN